MTRGKNVGVSASDPRLQAIVERLKAGATSLTEESKALGFGHNGPLRAALRELIGKEEFAVVMAIGVAGRQSKLKGRTKTKCCSPVPAESPEGSEQA